MVPTRRYYQAFYSYLIILYTCMHKITFQSALLLFRMKTVLDLECLIEEYKNDLNEHGALTAPVVRNGLVVYINYKLTNDNPNETAKIVEN